MQLTTERMLDVELAELIGWTQISYYYCVGEWFGYSPKRELGVPARAPVPPFCAKNGTETVIDIISLYRAARQRQLR